MKKMLPLFALGLFFGMQTYAQVTTIPLSPATTLTGTTQFTNDYISMSFSEEAGCHFCGNVYEVYSLHTTTAILSNESFAFEPGYSYTIQVNGSSVASGDLSGSGPATIYYGVSLGSEATTTSAATAFPLDPSAGLLSPSSNYAGGLAFLPPLDLWQGYGTVDLTSSFLSGVTEVGSLPNSATSSNSTKTASFQVGSSVLGFNIEPFPVVGTEPSFQSISEDGGTGTINPTTAATTTTLTLNSVIITATPLITPLVNYTCSSQTYSIPGTTAANWTVTPAGVVSLSTTSGTSVTVTKLSEGNCILTATLPGTSISNSIAISTLPTVTVASSEIGSCDASDYQAWSLAATANTPTATNWVWTATLDNGPYTITSTTAPNTTVSIDGRLELSVSYEDACGNKPPQIGTAVVFSNCNEPEVIHFDASPNPASSTVELLPHHNPGGVQLLINEIKVFDLQGHIRSDVHYGGVTQQKVSVGNLQNGVYFVLIYMKDGQIERKKIIVQH